MFAARMETVVVGGRVLGSAEKPPSRAQSGFSEKPPLNWGLVLCDGYFRHHSPSANGSADPDRFFVERADGRDQGAPAARSGVPE